MLENLQPKAVFGYFEEICAIPHGSGNIDQISEYLVNFAKSHGLEYIQDGIKNVIIIKEATEGYEKEEPFIIQGHMDMVAVKNSGCTKNMEKDGLDIAIDGDYIYAKDTSLGADDGIAVSYALALLASKTISHPRLEVLITVEEETGMDGAFYVDLSMLKGKRLLNIDSETQGELTVSCAGGVRVNGEFSCEFETFDKNADYDVCTLKVTGLTGGHSGAEIHHNRANSNVLLGYVFKQIQAEVSVKVISIEGGTKDNVISSESITVFAVAKADKEKLEAVLSKVEKELIDKHAKTDAGLRITRDYKEMEEDVKVMPDEFTGRFASYLTTVPNGVQAMSGEMEGLVETSLNLGTVRMYEGGVMAASSLRSSNKAAKDELRETVVKTMEEAGAKASLSSDYPAWEWKKDNKLVEVMSTLYEKMFREKAKVMAIHAGLECGILADKIEGLDSVSFGPDMMDVHTTKEKLSISSTAQMWEYLLALVQTKAEDV